MAPPLPEQRLTEGFTDAPAAGRTGAVKWPQAGFVLFAFAAPSACAGVAYSVGMAGLLGGPLLCVIMTSASMGGSAMLLQLRLRFRDCTTLGAIGHQVLGPRGKLWGDFIQLGNFVLFMPVALLLCASALRGIVSVEAFGDCDDYYIFAVALLCLLTTQVRDLRNAQLLSFISLLSVFGMCAVQIIAAVSMPDPAREPARLFGNPEQHWLTNTVQALLGATTCAWAYVPAFLTVELATVMDRPENFVRSLALSGCLNVAMFVAVGTTVVRNWGFDIEDPVQLTKVAAWDEGRWTNKVFSCCLFVGNLVSYALDSVPLSRFCQRTWAPEFADTWSCADTCRYFLYSLPTFTFALVLSVVVPNLYVLLAFTTALTVPWVTQIYPAVLYLKMHSGSLRSAGPKLSLATRCGVLWVLGVGSCSFAACLLAALGKVGVTEIRGPSQVGCDGWILWKG